MAASSVPEPGQLVDIRRRQWVVTNVGASGLDGSSQHLVSLVSVEDDAFDEELQVVWEIEPGARLLETAGLPRPSGFDPPAHHAALLDAVRWGAVTNADLDALQAPFRSGAIVEDYQLDPVVRALQMPRVNLLLADDVGLGKTIEAGLVVQELLLRHRARTVLVLCPASLQIKWQEELRDKFGLEFRIIDSQFLRDLRRQRGIHTNPWSHFPRLIASVDWFKRDTPLRLFTDTLPIQPTYPRTYDVLIVDEAHNVAPTGTGHYAVDSLRTQALRRIVPHFEHRLFLTATPHNGYAESFTALLELLDNQRFARGIPVDEKQLRTVMVRRLKSDIVDWRGQPRFPRRKLIPIEVDYSEAERAMHAQLVAYSRLRLARANEAGSQYANEFVLKLLKKRLFSSPAAFAITLEQHRSSLAADGKKKTTKRPASIGILRRAIAETDEEYADDDRVEDAQQTAVEVASETVDPLASEERTLLDAMQAWAETARHRPDAKAQALLAWLAEHIRPNRAWSDERVIIFTEYRATQNWLLDVLAANGYAEGDRLLTMYGGMPSDRREQIKAAFQASPEVAPVRILLATDAASEGIDLQNHCHRMIHMEIPWNPNRLEQRNGRIDRHGQKADAVLIYHFVGAGYQEREFDADNPGGIEGDLEFLMRAALKVEAIRQDLGRVGTVIADQVEEVMLGKRTRLDTAAAERQAAAARRLLRLERDIRDRVNRLHERLLESRSAIGLTPDAVENLVTVGLKLAGQPPLTPANRDGVRLAEMPALGGSWARCSEGLNHPHTGVRRPITFDQATAEGRDDVVLAHLSHRLVDMCQRLLRAEVWAPPGQQRLHRITARVVPRSAIDAPVVLAHARLIVQGSRGHRLHEEVAVSGGVIQRGGRFRRLAIAALERLWDASTPELPRTNVQDDLLAVWPRIEDGLLAAIEARATERMRSLTNTLERRRRREIADMTATLEQLARTIESELNEPDIQQLELWTPEEEDQLRRNVDALRLRVAAIPAEIEAEVRSITARYADPMIRTFPVAVTFLVPEGMT